MYFSLFRSFEQSALALINGVALEFFTVVKYILPLRIFYFWATCACPESRVCPEIFKPGGATAPPDPRLVRLCSVVLPWSPYPMNAVACNVNYKKPNMQQITLSTALSSFLFLFIVFFCPGSTSKICTKLNHSFFPIIYYFTLCGSLLWRFVLLSPRQWFNSLFGHERFGGGST